MSIVSGIATAPGISALLNAPREQSASDKTNPGNSERAGQSADRAGRTERLPGLPARSQIHRAGQAGTALALPTGAASKDPRMVRFVEAVQAIRLDAETATTLSPDRISRLRAAAKLVFKFVRDIPREVRPTEFDFEPAKPAIPAKPVEQADRLPNVPKEAPEAPELPGASSTAPATEEDTEVRPVAKAAAPDPAEDAVPEVPKVDDAPPAKPEATTGADRRPADALAEVE